MVYTAMDRYYQISRYAKYKYGDKLTEFQLKEAIFMITRTQNEKTIMRYIDALQRDNQPLALPQFIKENGYYVPTPNRPKSPNDLIAQAYREQEEREKQLLKQGQKALEPHNEEKES